MNWSLLVLLCVGILEKVLSHDSPRQVVYLDMTYIFDKTTLYWGSQQSPVLEDISEAENDTYWYYNNFGIGEHVGTHIDAPIHLRGGPQDDISMIPLERLTGPGISIDIRDKIGDNINYALSLDDVIEFEAQYGIIPPGAMVFQCSGWGDYWNDTERYFGGDPTVIGAWNFPSFSVEAAEFLVHQRSIHCLGSDVLSIDVGNSSDFPVHHATLWERICVLENVRNTCELPPIGSTVYAFPLNIRHSSGFPTRVVASYQPEVVETLKRKIKDHPMMPYTELLENAAMKAHTCLSLLLTTCVVYVIIQKLM